MTSADGASKRSPWLSIWFKPGDTIEGLLATKPKRNLLLLATLGVAYMIVSTMVDEGLTTALVDWRFLVGTAFIAAIMGIVSLYLSALFLSWSGRIFGG